MVAWLDRWGSLGGQLPIFWVNYLTPVWILCVGFFLGLLLCAAVTGIGYALSRLPVVSTLSDQPATRWISIGIVSVLALIVMTSWAAAWWPGALTDFTIMATILLLAIGIGFSAVYLVNRKAMDDFGATITEGPLTYLLGLALTASAFGILGIGIVRQPGTMLETLARWPLVVFSGTTVTEHQIAAPPGEFEEPPAEEIPVKFRRREIAQLKFESTRRLKLAPRPFDQGAGWENLFTVPADEPGFWKKPKDGSNPFPNEEVTKLYVKNYDAGAATLKITASLTHAHPEMTIVPSIALGVLLVFLAYVVPRAAFPKIAAVALATTKSEIVQPLYLVLLIGGGCLLFLFDFIPYNTFGEDIKMLQDTGLTAILILCLVQGVWAASASVADEIEGKTALTLLSKPVARRDFVIGKFLGISWATLLLCTVLGSVLVMGIAYKPLYDEREGADYEKQGIEYIAIWQVGFDEITRTLPGLVLVLMSAIVLISVSVALSTRVPTMANLIICLTIYIVGNLITSVVQSQVIAEQFEPVVVIGRVVATVIPVFQHFNIRAAISGGIDVPAAYVAWSFVYCALYSSIMMLLALTLFEDRDLA